MKPHWKWWEWNFEDSYLKTNTRSSDFYKVCYVSQNRILNLTPGSPISTLLHVYILAIALAEAWIHLMNRTEKYDFEIFENWKYAIASTFCFYSSIGFYFMFDCNLVTKYLENIEKFLSPVLSCCNISWSKEFA